jgi:hypothetical protein
MRSITISIAALVLLAGTSAPAATLCSKKSGVVVLRDACKKKETAIDPVGLGLQGPQGVQGVQGPMGPQGPGADTALVAADGTILAQSGSITVTPVPLLGAGYYLITVPTDVQTRTVQVTTFAKIGDTSFRGASVYIICGTAPSALDCVGAGIPGAANDGKTLLVITTASTGSTSEAHGFALSVI